MQTINRETGTKYSRAELKAAFDLVCNKNNWKLPISKALKFEGTGNWELGTGEWDTGIITDAVIFFTGSVPRFQAFDGGFHVSAEGYYEVIGS